MVLNTVNLFCGMGGDELGIHDAVYTDLKMAQTRFDLDDVKRTSTDDLCALCANWNTWWNQEKAGRKARRSSKEAKNEA